VTSKQINLSKAVYLERAWDAADNVTQATALKLRVSQTRWKMAPITLTFLVFHLKLLREFRNIYYTFVEKEVVLLFKIPMC